MNDVPNRTYPYDFNCENLAYRLAIAADMEAIWCKDIFRFPDLLTKHCLPSEVSDHTIHMAESITRQITLDMIEYINERSARTRQQAKPPHAPNRAAVPPAIKARPAKPAVRIQSSK